MREYLFRGKRVDNGEWVEGMPCSDLKGGVDAIQSNLGGGIFDIYPESFGQYTGMKDKNSRKIFEGDIIERVWFGSLSTYKIVFDDGIGAFIGESQNMKFTTFDYDSDCFEVIGNVFENAELLEG